MRTAPKKVIIKQGPPLASKRLLLATSAKTTKRPSPHRYLSRTR